MAAQNDGSPSTLQQYLRFTTTRKRFEPCHNLFTFPLVHSTHCHTIWQLYKKLEGVFASIEFQNLWSSFIIKDY